MKLPSWDIGEWLLTVGAVLVIAYAVGEIAPKSLLAVLLLVALTLFAVLGSRLGPSRGPRRADRDS